MASYSRRRFLEDSLFAAATAIAMKSGLALAAEAEQQSKSPSERLGVAVIGVRGRGGDHIANYLNRDDVEILYVVDPDDATGQGRAEAIGKAQQRAPKHVRDLREVLEDKAVDITSIATPNHWHALAAIWSMQAGKDVYVEKPVSHNVSEGRRIVEAARKYNRICQTGTQSRSNPGMRDMVEYVRSGQLGEVKLARGLCYKRRGSIGPKGQYELPTGLDYDLWCGPAPMKPLERPQLHYDWHWTWEYGNGDLGNQGIHQMDMARWGLGVDQLSDSVQSYGGRFGYEDAGETANTQVITHNWKDRSLVFEVRGLPTDGLLGATVGTIFYGSEGYAVNPSYYAGGSVFDKDGKVIKSFNGEANHYHNFLTAVRSRKVEDLNADILEGHLSSALCHLGNISYRLGQHLSLDEARAEAAKITSQDDAAETFGRTLEHLRTNSAEPSQIQFGKTLELDAESETFRNAPEEATAMLTREYRAPFIVPSAKDV